MLLLLILLWISAQAYQSKQLSLRFMLIVLLHKYIFESQQWSKQPHSLNVIMEKCAAIFFSTVIEGAVLEMLAKQG